MNAVQEERFLALKEWRKAKARELDIPAFVVFSDQTLRQLAIAQPQSMDGLRATHGIGDKKLEKFGPELLALLE